MKFKIGDTIIVTLGKDKDRKGKITAVYPKANEVKVPGVHIVKKHMKRKDEKNAGGIVEIVKPIATSKIALICPSCSKQTRIGYLVTKNLPAGRQAEKVRVCRKCHKKI